jgi:uncharacterized protein
MKTRAGVLVFGLLFCVTQLSGQSDPDRLLLKDFRPQSIFKIPQSNSRRYNLPVIDMHSHAYAATARELDEWVKLLRELGISKTIILTGATGTRFDSLYEIYSRYPDVFEVWCGFDYSGIGTDRWPSAGLAELERCYKKGARGVGELGDKGMGELYSFPVKGRGIHIDNKNLKPLLERCGALGMPINIHVAEPEWMYMKMDSTNDGLMNAFTWKVDTTASGFLNPAKLIQTLENAVRENPRTTFIACHFANCETDLSILSRLLNKYPNLYADISARYGETSAIPRYMKSFYTKHAGKLVYGTDMGMGRSMYQTTFRILETADEHFYETELLNYHWPLHGFDLDTKTLKTLYSGNALKILTQRK